MYGFFSGEIKVPKPVFWGAGDGVTDDTATIQAAIDAGEPLVDLPAGTYLVTQIRLGADDDDDDGRSDVPDGDDQEDEKGKNKPIVIHV